MFSTVAHLTEMRLTPAAGTWKYGSSIFPNSCRGEGLIFVSFEIYCNNNNNNNWTNHPYFSFRHTGNEKRLFLPL